jgi:hypothetical protein
MSMGSISVLILAAQLAGPVEDSESPRTTIEPTQSELEAYRLPASDILTDIDVTESSPIYDVTGWGMVAASVADVATTEWGLSQGLSEGNPVASGRGLRIATHVVGPAAVWWTTDQLDQAGHRKLALSLRIALMAAYSYAAIHNVHKVGTTPGGFP